MKRLTGVLGGMFDPVHLGHLEAARAALEACDLDEVLLLPCGNPVHRDQAHCSADERCRMLELAIGTQPRMTIDRRECDSPAPSRMVETLEALHEARPDDAFCLILGMDAFLSFASWHRWQDILDLAHLVVLTRPGFDLAGAQALAGGSPLADEFARRAVAAPSGLRQARAGRILLVEADTPDVSSTLVREQLQDEDGDLALQAVLPPPVIEHIRTHGLYTGNPHT